MCLFSNASYAGSLSSFFSSIVATRETDVIYKITKKPETFFNQTVQELENTLGQFGDKKTKSSYLNSVIENYSISYPKKDNITINVFGKENTINYIVNLSDSLASDADSSNKPDFGFKKAICESTMNTLFLENGVVFNAKYMNDGVFLYKKTLSENCFNELNTLLPEEKNKQLSSQSKEQIVMISPTTKEVEKSKAEIVYIPKEFIHADVSKNNTLETPEDLVIIKAIEDPVVTKQEVAKIITLNKEEKEKLHVGLIKKDQNLKEIISRIVELNDGATNEYEKRLFREHIAELTKEFYNKLLDAKKKDINKKPKNNIVVEKDFDTVNISVYFNIQSSSDLKKNKIKWKKNNEAKSFVCDDLFLSKMLDIGLKYKVHYYDHKNNLVYSDDVISNSKICKLK